MEFLNKVVQLLSMDIIYLESRGSDGKAVFRCPVWTVAVIAICFWIDSFIR